jgi:hypothetical protein
MYGSDCECGCPDRSETPYMYALPAKARPDLRTAFALTQSADIVANTVWHLIQMPTVGYVVILGYSKETEANSETT